MIRVVYTYTCRDCDWQPDPKARAKIETQIDRHVREAVHTHITLGRPEEIK